MQIGNPTPIVRPTGLPVPMKHDVPPYLQMLFSARGRLPYVRPMEKPPCRRYDFISHPVSGLMERLEATKEDDRPDYIPKAELKKKQWFEKLEEHKERVKEEYVKCMHELIKGTLSLRKR